MKILYVLTLSSILLCASLFAADQPVVTPAKISDMGVAGSIFDRPDMIETQPDYSDDGSALE